MLGVRKMKKQGGKFMMVVKRKELVAAALVVLIGVAGYLNWSYQDEIRVTDGKLYTETGKRLGEAQYVSSPKQAEEESTDDENSEEKAEKTSASDSFTSARLEKENARSKALEILNKSAENESFDEETRKQAQERILNMAANVEKEAVIENIARAKGFTELAVYIDGTSVDMLVKKGNLSEEDIIKLKDIAAEQLNISAKDIKIVEVK